MVSNKD